MLILGFNKPQQLQYHLIPFPVELNVPLMKISIDAMASPSDLPTGPSSPPLRVYFHLSPAPASRNTETTNKSNKH